MPKAQLDDASVILNLRLARPETGDDLDDTPPTYDATRRITARVSALTLFHRMHRRWKNDLNNVRADVGHASCAPDRPTEVALRVDPNWKGAHFIGFVGEDIHTCDVIFTEPVSFHTLRRVIAPVAPLLRPAVPVAALHPRARAAVEAHPNGHTLVGQSALLSGAIVAARRHHLAATAEGRRDGSALGAYQRAWSAWLANSVVIASAMTDDPHATEMHHTVHLEIVQEWDHTGYPPAETALYVAADVAGHCSGLRPDTDDHAPALLASVLDYLHLWMDELPRDEQRRAWAQVLAADIDWTA